MTPTERATLLLKVQRALDAAGVNRDNFGLTICTVHLDDGYYVALCSMAMEAEVIQNDPFERDYADMTTFTFAELFPELEWGRCAHGAQGVRVGTIHFGILGDDPECLRVSDPHYTVFIPLGTPERAKRAAQSIADLLAEAGREGE
jgi:hypothetical protein